MKLNKKYLLGILNTSASVASLSAFILMLNEGFENPWDWGLIIGYTFYGLTIIAILAIFLSISKYLYTFGKKQDMLIVWGFILLLFIIFCFCLIVLIKSAIIVATLAEALINTPF